MNSINPYEPSPHDKDCLKRSRIALTSSEVFTVGVIISMLFVLLLAQVSRSCGTIPLLRRFFSF